MNMMNERMSIILDIMVYLLNRLPAYFSITTELSFMEGLYYDNSGKSSEIQACESDERPDGKKSIKRI